MKRLLQLGLIISVLAIGLPIVAFGAQFDQPVLSPVTEGQAKVLAVVTAGLSGAPAGFTMQWMRFQDFEANGNQFFDTPNPLQADAVFDGVPTLNTWNGLIEDFSLSSHEFAPVELGDLFDETGLTTNPMAVEELEFSRWYIFRARANGQGSTLPSDWSNTFMIVTDTVGDCTFTQGYWKNHQEDWEGVTLTLGTVTYNQQQLLDILNTPAQGNGLLILAHQLIAAELNILQGANPVDVSFSLSQAHALIGGQLIPPLGSGYVHPRDASPVAQGMDDYNNGVIGPGHCITISVEESTWSRTKASYR